MDPIHAARRWRVPTNVEKLPSAFVSVQGGARKSAVLTAVRQSGPCSGCEHVYGRATCHVGHQHNYTSAPRFGGGRRVQSNISLTEPRKHFPYPIKLTNRYDTNGACHNSPRELHVTLRMDITPTRR